MASSLLLRRSVVATRAVKSLLRGAAATPPLPAFARIPAPTQKVNENDTVVVKYMESVVG